MRAIYPGTPLPGVTFWSFSSKTSQNSPIPNFAVFVPPSAVVTERPKPSPSEAPKLSISTTWGICLHRPALTSLLHITPDETMETRLLVSQRPGLSFSACSIGLAKASPTIEMLSTLCVSTVSHNSSASKDGSDRVTMAPPDMSVPIAVMKPVPCINGQEGSVRLPGP